MSCYLIISVPIDLVLGPMEREMMRRIVENMAGAEGFATTPIGPT